MARMRHGVNPILEAAADELIRQSYEGIKSHSAKRDILTPWKEQQRRSREVYAQRGTIDPSQRRGMYERAANPQAPHLNSIEGVGGGMGRTRVPQTDRTISLRNFVEGS